MKRIILSQMVCLIALSHLSQAANGASQGVSSVFDFSSGPTLSSNFDQPESTNNWVSGSFFGLAPHSGAQYFESDNGNSNSDFVGLHYAKQIGGSIENVPYLVSFYIASNSLGGQGMIAVQFSDFSELAIGGARGTSVWSSTPTPGVGQGWVQWSGIYTPSLTDIGTPFQFRMTLNINRRRSLALDGLMTATVPEPTTPLVLIVGATTLAISRGRRKRQVGTR
jgi:hypothetical protein